MMGDDMVDTEKPTVEELLQQILIELGHICLGVNGDRFEPLAEEEATS
jgi:hypothetical protein